MPHYPPSREMMGVLTEVATSKLIVSEGVAILHYHIWHVVHLRNEYILMCDCNGKITKFSGQLKEPTLER